MKCDAPQRVTRGAGESVIRPPAQSPGNCPLTAMISSAAPQDRMNDLMIVPTLA
jgi:hypothetical protein